MCLCFSIRVRFSFSVSVSLTELNSSPSLSLSLSLRPTTHAHKQPATGPPKHPSHPSHHDQNRNADRSRNHILGARDRMFGRRGGTAIRRVILQDGMMMMMMMCMMSIHPSIHRVCFYSPYITCVVRLRCRCRSGYVGRVLLEYCKSPTRFASGAGRLGLVWFGLGVVFLFLVFFFRGRGDGVANYLRIILYLPVHLLFAMIIIHSLFMDW